MPSSALEYRFFSESEVIFQIKYTQHKLERICWHAYELCVKSRSALRLESLGDTKRLWMCEHFWAIGVSCHVAPSLTFPTFPFRGLCANGREWASTTLTTLSSPWQQLKWKSCSTKTSWRPGTERDWLWGSCVKSQGPVFWFFFHSSLSLKVLFSVSGATRVKGRRATMLVQPVLILSIHW